LADDSFHGQPQDCGDRSMPLVLVPPQSWLFGARRYQLIPVSLTRRNLIWSLTTREKVKA